MSRCSHNSLNVCPFSLRSSSSNFLRLAVASALKTASITDIMQLNGSMSTEAFQVSSVMSFLNLEHLPFVAISYEIAVEKQSAPITTYMVTAKPAQSPPSHTHP